MNDRLLPAETAPSGRPAGKERKPHRLLSSAVLLALLVSLPGCKFTKNGAIDAAQSGEGAAPSFDPAAMVARFWTPQLLPYFDQQAKPATEVLAAVADNTDAAGRRYGHREKEEGAPWNFIVKGEGTILAADTQTRAATITVDLTPGDGKGDLDIQIGPVLRGTVIRDASDFIRFDEVTNQIQFAQLSRSINDRIRDQILKDVPHDDLIGRKVLFEGAFSAPSAGAKPLLTPISLSVEK